MSTTPSFYVAKGFTLNFDSTAIGAVTSIGGVEVSTDTEETTAVTDTDGYRSFIGTYHDGGEVAVEWLCKASDSGQAAVAAAMDDGEEHAIEIVFPTAMAKKWAFNAVVTKFKLGEAAVGNLLKGSATLKVSGQPSLTAVSNG